MLARPKTKQSLRWRGGRQLETARWQYQPGIPGTTSAEKVRDVETCEHGRRQGRGRQRRSMSWSDGLSKPDNEVRADTRCGPKARHKGGRRRVMTGGSPQRTLEPCGPAHRLSCEGNGKQGPRREAHRRGSRDLAGLLTARGKEGRRTEGDARIHLCVLQRPALMRPKALACIRAPAPRSLASGVQCCQKPSPC